MVISRSSVLSHGKSPFFLWSLHFLMFFPVVSPFFQWIFLCFAHFLIVFLWFFYVFLWFSTSAHQGQPHQRFPPAHQGPHRPQRRRCSHRALAERSRNEDGAMEDEMESNMRWNIMPW